MTNSKKVCELNNCHIDRNILECSFRIEYVLTSATNKIESLLCCVLIIKEVHLRLPMPSYLKAQLMSAFFYPPA